MFLGMFILLLGMIMILFYNFHYLILLLLLEVILLGLLTFFNISFFMTLSLLGGFTFLLMMVCMGGFSISLLVSVSRLIGRDAWVMKYVF